MPSTDEPLAEILKADPRYHPQAYVFVYEALGYTVNMLGLNRRDVSDRHVTGQQLLEGIRRLALREFGYLARTVFESWGVTRTDDWGAIVFNLVEGKMMNKTERDSREDFANGYSFKEAFETAYFRDRLYTDDEAVFEATSTIINTLPSKPLRPTSDADAQAPGNGDSHDTGDSASNPDVDGGSDSGSDPDADAGPSNGSASNGGSL